MTTQHVTAVGGFAYGAVGADIHVFGDGTPLYLLARWRPAPEPDTGWLAQQPSRMLNARFAVAPFTGREDELAALRAWCDGDPRRAVRWLHAPGGQGKTRLAQQLAGELDARGWTVVTAVEGPGTVLPPQGSQDLRLDGAAGLLLLVDYADRWPLTSLTWLFSNALLHRPGVPTRVLLLARGTDPWPALRAALAGEQVDVSTQALGPLTVDGEDLGLGPDGRRRRRDDRGPMFRAARDGFAARYGIAPPDHRPDLSHPDFGLTLAVHMAALVAVDAAATGRRAPEDLAGLTVYLLDREQLGWALLHDKRGQGRVTVPPAVMNQAVFAASLGGAQPEDRGTLLVDALDLGHPAATVLADHAACYPPAGEAAGTVLEPLYPDRLAEDFVALTLPGHEADYPAQPWAAGAAAAVLRHCGGPARPVTALATAAGRWPHVGRTCLYPLLAADPALGVAAGGAALTTLAGLPDVPFDLLEDVAGRVPVPVPPDLVVGRASVLVRLYPHRLATTGDVDRHARLHVNHGNNLELLGRTAEALEATRRGLELFRSLAEDDPAQYEAHVGKALTNVASQLGALGRREEALATQRQVVGIFERLVAAGPPGAAADTGLSPHTPDLATALANLSTYLEGSGKWEEAYDANERAADLYARAAAHDPQYRRGLAIALTNGATLTFRPPGQDAALERAVALARELVAEGVPVEDTPLVRALRTLGRRYTADGRHDDAVRAAEEVAAISRRFAGADPRRYTASSADALMELHSALLDAGRPERAMEAGDEAIALLRRLADIAPSSYETELVSALHEQNRARRAAGLPEDPEADARSRRVEVNPRRTIPAATVTVHGWLPDPLGRRTLSPALITAEAARLEALRDWPAYWELACAAPPAEAVRLARRIPRRGWLPDTASDRALLEWMRATVPRRAAALVAELARDATRRLPEDFALATPSRVALAPGGDALAVVHIRYARDGDDSETITTLDLGSGLGGARGTAGASGLEPGPRTLLYQGPVCHSSPACGRAGEVVAVRRRPGRDAEPELVRHRPDGTTVLAQGMHLLGLRVAATRHGYVAGLGLFPVALTLGPSDRLRQVGLEEWGLSHGGMMAVAPGGDRLVLSDGHRLVAADARLDRALAVGSVPREHAPVSDLVFAGDDLLVTAGNGGGLMLWRAGGYTLEAVAAQDTVRLSELFAVPAWGVVGALAGSQGRIRFFDPADGLAPAAAPAAFVGDPGRLRAVVASPGGRHVLYSGQLDVAEPPHRRSFERITRIHDLHHPGAILGRPLASLTPAQRAVLARATAPTRHQRDLIRLAHTLASRP